MLNTYIRDIANSIWLHPENTFKVPGLMEKLIGDKTSKVFDTWLPKLKASVCRTEDEDYAYIFRRSVDEILRKVFGAEYDYCTAQFGEVPSYIKSMESWLLGAEYDSEELLQIIELLPDAPYAVSDFTGVSRYTYWTRMHEIYEKFVKYYKHDISEEIESIKLEMFNSDKCVYTDIETCGAERLVDVVHSRALKRSDNIYDNWLQFCRLVQAWYSYLMNCRKLGGFPSLVVDITAYGVLIDNDVVDYIAAAWLPHKDKAIKGTNKGRAGTDVSHTKLVGDIAAFLETSDKDISEYEVAVNVVKTVAIGSELMQKGNRVRVVKLLNQAFSWDSASDTKKCKATMRTILKSYISERKKSHKPIRAYEILLSRV